MGKLIIFEGLDGSGKGTQTKLTADHLRQRGADLRQITFPNYESNSSALVKMYLAGEFGEHPDDVNAYAASSFYAVDRFASYKTDWGEFYREGGLVLSDRYTTSNAVHQASKEPPERRAEFLRWLYDLEYDRLGLPRPDLVLYLDAPVEFTAQLMRHREAETNTHADIHEQDLAYLRTCREMGRYAADYYGWKRIRCVENGALRSIEAIHEEIYALVAACLEES